MSIQLDGHVTYPYQLDNEEEEPSAHPVGGSSNHEEGAATGSISWDGFWHYSKKQTKGANELCGFKYFFAGPVDEPVAAVGDSKEKEKQPDTKAGGGGASVTPAAALALAAAAAENNPSSRGDAGENQAGIQGTLHTPADGQQAAKAATTPATGEDSSNPPAESTASSGPSPAGETRLPHLPTNDASGIDDQGSTGSATGGDGRAGRGVSERQVSAGGAPGEGVGTRTDTPVPLAKKIILYGPRGDGRLPSGKWTGFFIVKYGRGVEVKVQESFVLEFGSKSQRAPVPMPIPAAPPGPGPLAATAAAPPLSPPCTSNGDKPQVPKVEQNISSQSVAGTTGAAAVGLATAGGGAAVVTGAAVAAVATAAATAASSSPTPSVVVASVSPSSTAPAPVPTTAAVANSTTTAVATAGATEITAPEAADPLTAAATAAPTSAAPTPPAIAAWVPALVTPVPVATAVITTPVAPVAPASMAPVVRVSGSGHNKYGEFTLTGGHERATGRLDLTRFYFEKPKEVPAGRASSLASSRGERAGRGVSHQKKRRPPSLGGQAPQPPGPSLAERRTKRTRCPNQRLLDDEVISHSSHSDAAIGGSGSGAGPGSSKRKSSNEGASGAANSSAESGGSAAAAAASAHAGGAGVASPAGGGGSTKSRKPRDRERDLFMEQNRRARRKAEEAGRIGTSAIGDGNGSRGSVCSSPSESAAAELAARAEAGREVLAVIGSASEDPVVKEAFANMEIEQATLEAEAAAAATAAAEATSAAEAQAAAAVAAERATLAESNGTGWGGNGGGSGSSRTGRGPGRSKRAAAERWEELTLDRETGEHYEGGWFRGRRHGKGLCVYADGRMYEGDWRAGKEHGLGKIMQADRVVLYEGEIADGKLCGKGRYTDGSGAVYNGEWKESAMHGRGVYEFPVSSQAIDAEGEVVTGTMVYDGELRDNARCGRGLQTWPGGSYDGEWLADAKHGRGILRTDDGFVYDGQWVDDLAEGRGMCIHQDGQRYEGVFRGGKKEGRGTLAFANGASYEGRFRDDAIDGQGMLHIPKPVEDDMGGWMIPIQFQSDIERIHVKAGFDKGGL